MASDLGGGGRIAERRAEALDPDALRDLRRRPRGDPAKTDRPHPRVPAWAPADRPLAARWDRPKRRHSRSLRPARIVRREGIPGTEPTRDVSPKQSDRVSGGGASSPLRKRMS